MQPDHVELRADLGLVEAAFGAHAGVVDEQFEVGDGGNGSRHALDVAFVGQIGDQRLGTDAVGGLQLGCERFQPVAAARDQHQVVAATPPACAQTPQPMPLDAPVMARWRDRRALPASEAFSESTSGP